MEGGWLSIAIGVFLIGFWIFLRSRAIASSRWPSVAGKILESRVVRLDDGPIESIKYSYVVGGNSFQGHRVGMIRGPNAYDAVQRYPLGADVPVFYDPKRPGSAVLERGSSGGLALVVIGFCTIVMGIMLIAVFNSAEKQDAADAAKAQARTKANTQRHAPRSRN